MADRATRILARGMFFLGAVLYLAVLVWMVWFMGMEMPSSPAAGGTAVVQVVAALPSPTHTPTRLAPLTPLVLSPTPSPLPTREPATSTLTPTLFPLPDAGSRDEATATPEPEPTTARMVRPRARATAAPPTLTPTPTSRPADPPARIVAPAIGLDAAIVPVGWETVVTDGKEISRWIVPRNLVGWHETSALPGEYGNTVLSGHSNVYARVFRRVPDLEPGDEITIRAGERSFVYTVREKHLVREADAPASERARNALWIAPTGDVRLTLVTCWPVTPPGNTHRMIVVAKP